MNRPNQSGIQQISRTALSTTRATPTIRKSPHCDMENNKNSSSRLQFSNSKTTSKTTRRSNNKTQNKTQQKQKKQNHKHCTNEQDACTPQYRMSQTGRQASTIKIQIKTPIRNQKHNNHAETCRKSAKALRSQTPRH